MSWYLSKDWKNTQDLSSLQLMLQIKIDDIEAIGFFYSYTYIKRESSSKQENFVQNTGMNVDVTQSNHELSE